MCIRNSEWPTQISLGQEAVLSLVPLPIKTRDGDRSKMLMAGSHLSGLERGTAAGSLGLSVQEGLWEWEFMREHCARSLGLLTCPLFLLDLMLG